jgi:hypothetical protein
MRPLVAAHFSLGLILTACGRPDPQVPVVLQGWRNLEHAQQVCERARNWQQQNRGRIAELGCERVALCREMTPLIARCVGDPAGEVRAFEDELLARAAAEPKCKNVRFVRLNERSNPDEAARAVLQEPHWQLSLDYQPGDAGQRWGMTDDPSRATFPKGEGSPQEIAAEVCAVVIERGAKLLN